MDSTSTQFTREQLYTVLWERPARGVAKDLGISDYELLKICRKFNIPKPGPGYWHLLTLGKADPKPDLPTAPSDVPAMILVPQNKQNNLLKIEGASGSVARPLIQIPEDFRNAHPLIRRTKQILENGRSDKYNRLTAGLQGPRLNIKVSKQSLRRTLLILDGLTAELEKFGYKLNISEWGHEFVKVSSDTSVRISVTEKVDRKERELTTEERSRPYIYDQWRYIPTGELTFRIEECYPERSKKTWSDRSRKKLESQLSEIVTGLETVAEALRLENIKRAEAHRLWEEEQKRRQELERLRQEEEAKKKLFEERAEAWAKSQRLYAFITACESELMKLGEIPKESPAGKWLHWAKTQAVSHDPFHNGYLSRIEKLQHEFFVEVQKCTPKEPGA